MSFHGHIDGSADVTAAQLDGYLAALRDGIETIVSSRGAHFGKAAWEVGHVTYRDVLSTIETVRCSYRVILSGGFDDMDAVSAADHEHDLLADLHDFFVTRDDAILGSNLTFHYLGSHQVTPDGLITAAARLAEHRASVAEREAVHAQLEADAAAEPTTTE